MPRSKNTTTWIKVRDFEEVSYWVSIVNATTHTPVSDSGIDLAEVSESGLVLKLPAGSCAQGQHLLIDVLKQRMQAKNGKSSPKSLWRIQATAKVIQLEPIDERSSIVTVQFYQLNEKQWARFLKEFSDRQAAVNLLVRKIAG